jgi:hypothetical protein
VGNDKPLGRGEAASGIQKLERFGTRSSANIRKCILANAESIQENNSNFEEDF